MRPKRWSHVRSKDLDAGNVIRARRSKEQILGAEDGRVSGIRWNCSRGGGWGSSDFRDDRGTEVLAMEAMPEVSLER
jgi:hypothetical protein